MNARNVAAVVLGEQLTLAGETVPEFEARLQMMASDFRQSKFHYILLSGGHTAPGKRSEAEVARDWLVEHEQIPTERITLETQSLTTGQNIKFCTSLLLKLGISEVLIYGRRSQRPKTMVLCNVFWRGYFYYEFVTCPDHKGFGYRLVDQTVMVVLARLDPRERHLTKWLNALLRRRFVKPT